MTQRRRAVRWALVLGAVAVVVGVSFGLARVFMHEGAESEPSGTTKTIPELAPIEPVATVEGVVAPFRSERFDPRAIAVDFVDADVGFLAGEGATLRRTRNGGRSWQEVGAFWPQLHVLAFVDGSLGFALSGRRLLRVEERKWRWTRSTLHTFPPASRRGATARDLVFVDADHGWAVPPDGRLYRTGDGGRTWTRLRGPCAGDLRLSIDFVSATYGIAACAGQPATIQERRAYYRTDDGGATWRLTGEGVFVGHLAGLEEAAPGVVFERAGRLGLSRASGREVLLDTDDLEEPVSMSWIDAAHGYVLLSRSGLARTADGGRTWRFVYPKSLPQPTGPVSFTVEEGIGLGFGQGIRRRSDRLIGWTWDDGGHGSRWPSRRRRPSTCSSDLRTRSSGRSRDRGSTSRGIGEGTGGPLAGSSSATIGGSRSRPGGRATSATSSGTCTEPATAAGPGASGAIRPASPPPYSRRTIMGSRSWASIDSWSPPTAARAWRRQEIAGDAIPLAAVTAYDSGHVWVVARWGCETECRTLLYRTVTGGRTWTAIRLDQAVGIDGIEWDTAYVGYAWPYLTRDGGVTWQVAEGYP